MNKKLIIENTLVFLFVLLLLPFPKLIEEILIGSIFSVCFIFSLFYFLFFKSAKMCQTCL